MSSSEYYRYLDISPNCFDRNHIEAVFSKFLDQNKNNQWRDWTRPESLFSSDIRAWLDSLGCVIGNIELFYTIPQCLERVFHIDMDPPRDYVKINFIWGSDQHVMQWGESKSLSQTLSSSKTVVGTDYLSYHETDIDIRESLTIKNPVLVNVGRPHRVLNYRDQGRWCLCLIPRRKKTNQRILFQEALDIFSMSML